MFKFLEKIVETAFLFISGYEFGLYLINDFNVKHIIASGICMLAARALTNDT